MDFLRSTHNLKKISSWFWRLLSKSADLSKPWGRFFFKFWVLLRKSKLYAEQFFDSELAVIFKILKWLNFQISVLIMDHSVKWNCWRDPNQSNDSTTRLDTLICLNDSTTKMSLRRSACSVDNWWSQHYTQSPLIKNSPIRKDAEILGKSKERALDRSNLRNASKNLRNAQCSDFQR